MAIQVVHNICHLAQSVVLRQVCSAWARRRAYLGYNPAMEAQEDRLLRLSLIKFRIDYCFGSKDQELALQTAA